MDRNPQDRDAALRSRIAKLQNQLEQVLSSQERALTVIELRELREELALLTEDRNSQLRLHDLVELDNKPPSNLLSQSGTGIEGIEYPDFPQSSVSRESAGAQSRTAAMRSPAVSVPWQLLCICTLATIVGFFKLPYGYYMVLRAVMCIAGAYGFSLSLQRHSDKWMWVYGVVTVLYNPVFPVHLGSKELWIFLNLATLGMFWAAFRQSRRVTHKKLQ